MLLFSLCVGATRAEENWTAIGICYSMRVNMHYELDHLFICTSAGSPEAGMLTAFGLTEGPGNTHPGQGTANRRFFFQNTMLELLWVNNEAEATSELTRPTRLWERWGGRDQGCCPFGVCFRPTSETDIAPFPSWKYKPKYLPESLSIDVAKNIEILTEPMLFFLAFARRIKSSTGVKPDQNIHAIGFRNITRVKIIAPRGRVFSPELQEIAEIGLISVDSGEEYLMEIGFDGENVLKTKDFRPALPLVFRW